MTMLIAMAEYPTVSTRSIREWVDYKADISEQYWKNHEFKMTPSERKRGGFMY